MGMKPGTVAKSKEVVIVACQRAIAYHREKLGKPTRFKDVHKMVILAAEELQNRAIMTMGLGVVMNVEENELVEDWMDSGYRLPKEKICA